jgi:hypothetical protein
LRRRPSPWPFASRATRAMHPPFSRGRRSMREGFLFCM